MTHHIRTLSLSAGVATLLLLAAATFATAEEAVEVPCADCHDEVAAAFAATLHGRATANAPSCVTCHGDGTRHMEEGGDATLIGKPAGPAGAAICAGCHATTLHAGFGGASPAHEAAEVYCGDCHAVHTTEAGARALLRREPGPLCASCHPAQQAQFQRPYGHRLDRSGVQCVSCHDPHAGTGTHSLRTDRSGDGPCVSCHAEKRGPFVYSHPGTGSGTVSAATRRTARPTRWGSTAPASTSSASSATARSPRAPSARSPHRSTTCAARAIATAPRATSRSTAPRARPRC